jgi:hypothetical protein
VIVYVEQHRRTCVPIIDFSRYGFCVGVDRSASADMWGVLSYKIVQPETLAYTVYNSLDYEIKNLKVAPRFGTPSLLSGENLYDHG